MIIVSDVVAYCTFYLKNVFSQVTCRVTDIRISANDVGWIESYLLLKNYCCKIMKNKFVVQTNLLIICVIVLII